MTHFKPKTMTLHFRLPNGPPKAVVVLAFQIGVEAVRVRDVSLDAVVDIVSDRPFLIKLSIGMANHNNSKDFDKKKDSFVAEATATIGAKQRAPGQRFLHC